MLFQQSNDMEFAGVFYYFVVAPLAITPREDCTRRFVCGCVCLPSIRGAGWGGFDLPVNLSNCKCCWKKD